MGGSVHHMWIRLPLGEIPSSGSQYVNMLDGHKSDLPPEAPPLWFAFAVGGCVWVWVWRCKGAHINQTE